MLVFSERYSVWVDEFQCKVYAMEISIFNFRSGTMLSTMSLKWPQRSTAAC